MWNYVFFIAYLKDKDETEYTGNETYVFEKIKHLDHNWFPFQRYLQSVFLFLFSRALALKNYEEAEGEENKAEEEGEEAQTR